MQGPPGQVEGQRPQVPRPWSCGPGEPLRVSGPPLCSPSECSLLTAAPGVDAKHFPPEMHTQMPRARCVSVWLHTRGRYCSGISVDPRSAAVWAPPTLGVRPAVLALAGPVAVCSPQGSVLPTACLPLPCNQGEVTARCRIARALGLRRPTRGACIPSVYKPVDPSLGLMRADIGVAPLSLFGDPSELDPIDR